MFGMYTQYRLSYMNIHMKKMYNSILHKFNQQQGQFRGTLSDLFKLIKILPVTFLIDFLNFKWRKFKHPKSSLKGVHIRVKFSFSHIVFSCNCFKSKCIVKYLCILYMYFILLSISSLFICLSRSLIYWNWPL